MLKWQLKYERDSLKLLTLHLAFQQTQQATLREAFRSIRRYVSGMGLKRNLQKALFLKVVFKIKNNIFVKKQHYFFLWNQSKHWNALQSKISVQSKSLQKLATKLLVKATYLKAFKLKNQAFQNLKIKTLKMRIG